MRWWLVVTVCRACGGLWIMQALTVHYQSYINSVKLVLSVDEAQFPDGRQLLDDFAESLRIIREAAPGKPGDTQDAAST
jgi:hypothetical protein